MNDPPASTTESLFLPARQLAIAAGVSVGLLWLAQPPAMLWPCALIALVPWLMLITSSHRIGRKGYVILWLISTLYWLVSLQGLRHAHPAMCIPWFALGGYLASYHVLFVFVVRRMLELRVPLIVAVPFAWVAQECIRNYLLTGISAVMLGHSMADVPRMIQIADMFGSYGVSFVLAMVNVAAFALLDRFRGNITSTQAAIPLLSTALALIATLWYGNHRLHEPLGDVPTTFALVQRNEVVDYGQPLERETEMFQNYARQSVDSIRGSQRAIDVVVWPESMFSGGLPWMIADRNAKVPEVASMSQQEFQLFIAERRAYFLQRAVYVQNAIAQVNPSSSSPHLLVGCGVVHYKDVPNVYSGVISLRPDGTPQDWYGKTHLVMFGEYIPIAPHVPVLRSLVPPGMGLQTGPGAKRFDVGESFVSPNICIETAVERVTVDQLASFAPREIVPDVVVTVTNDGWFDDSSVIDHHLRCAQLVAVGCRRPILSAANNGPTAWIDSCGRIVDQLSPGTDGAVIATPQRDHRISLYLQIGDWPARLCVLACLAMLVVDHRRKRLKSR